jgi:NAD-dependent deacetylase
MNNYQKAAQIIKTAKHLIAFTGAGISKESGIPIFRGDEGVYSKYDPKLLELNTYKSRTAESWKAVKAIFYDFFDAAIPNAAHIILAEWENSGLLKCVITQNIDNLHKEAGSKNVIEYHGTKDSFVCLSCGKLTNLKSLKLSENIPICPYCSGILKPNFIFFGEAIPEYAAEQSYIEAKKADVVIIIGTTGEVQPASYIPHYAKKAGAYIIEINPTESRFTNSITDLYIAQSAGGALTEINNILNC